MGLEPGGADPAHGTGTGTGTGTGARLMTTSTPSISSVRAPLTAASNMACRVGDGV
jgi:hypothetical protein